jgi:hypothetical protein
MDKLYCGKGKLYAGVAQPGGGAPVLQWLGDVSKFTLTPKATTIDHRESYTGMNTRNGRIVTQNDLDAAMTLEEVIADNLALGLWGTNASVQGGTVTAEVLPSGAVVGSLLALANPKVSSVVITDSSASPKTLVAGTNYSVNADQGSINILDITTGGPFTQPFKAAYTYAAYTRVAVFNALAPARYLRYEGVNLQDGSPFGVEIYIFKGNPLKTLELIGDKFQNLDIDGACLLDSTKPSDSVLGQFGRVFF